MATPFERSFWRALRADSWERQAAVFRGVAPGSLGTDEDLLDAIVRRVSDAPYAGMPPIKFYRGNSAEALHLPSAEHRAFEPRRDDGTLAAYLARLGRETGGTELGFIVNHVQALQPTIFSRASALLEVALDELPFPSGGTFCSSFFGTYRSTQVGIHKDAQNVFVLPVSGPKTFYFWTDEALADHPAVRALGEEARARKVRIASLPFREVADLAHRIEAAPGDLLYVPKGLWHVAEPRQPYNVSFHIGLFSNEPPPERLAAFFRGPDGFRDLEPALLRGPALTRWRRRHGLGVLPPAASP